MVDIVALGGETTADCQLGEETKVTRTAVPGKTVTFRRFEIMTAWPIGPDAALQDTLRVILRDVVTEAHVGLHPWERHPERPTRLTVNVEMFARLLPGTTAAAYGLMDYDPIRLALKSWPGRPHTDLLETLVDELVALCLANPFVQACRVSVTKPDIFNEAAAAGVELFRVRS